MVYLHTWDLINLNLVWYYVDTCYIHQHVFGTYISYYLATGGSIKELESPERWHGCVQLQASCLAQQDKVTGVFLFMHLTIMCLW